MSIIIIYSAMQECNNLWQAGRKACSAISLTGNPCTLPPHRLQALESTSQPTRSNQSTESTTERVETSREDNTAAEPLEENLVACAHSSGIVHHLVESTGLTR